MKESTPLIAVSAFFVVGVVLWYKGADIRHPGDIFNRPTLEEVTTPQAASPQPASLKAKPAPPTQAAAVTKEVAPVVEVQPVEVEAIVETKPTTPRVDPTPFPSTDEVAVGEPQEIVIEKYGAPAISTLTSSGGHMMGSYVYAKDRGRQETMIRLEDGRVASAYSISMPPAPTGMQVPRYVP